MKREFSKIITMIDYMKLIGVGVVYIGLGATAIGVAWNLLALVAGAAPLVGALILLILLVGIFGGAIGAASALGLRDK